MNEPIISPYIIYLLSLVENVRFVLAIASFGLAIFMVLSPAWTDSFTEHVGCFKKMVVAFIVSVILLVFIPSSDVITKMLIAQHVTPQNIQMIGDGVDKSIDRVIEKIINYQTKLKESK